MERLQRGYIALKGFAIAIAMGLLVYLVLNGVLLAERYVEAKEIETRYINDEGYIIDLKELKLYMCTKNGDFIKYDQSKDGKI
jgi:hypothetical protein